MWQRAVRSPETPKVSELPTSGARAATAAMGSALAELTGASRRQFTERWKSLYGSEPPIKTARNLLVLAIAYRLQEQDQGGLKPSLRRQLLEFAEDDDAAASRKVRAGTVLVREWHGVSYTVTVLDKGVTFEGKLYRSLTEVAEVITGNHWSGPVFFGLAKDKKGAR